MADSTVTPNSSHPVSSEDPIPAEEGKLVLLRPLSKRGRSTWFLLYVSGLIFWETFRMLLQMPGRPELLPGRPGAVAGVLLAVIGLGVGAFRAFRDRDDRAVFYASGYLLVFPLLSTLGTSTPQYVVPFVVVPAIFMIWTFVRITRRADELEKSILYQALSTAFVATCVVVVGYTFAEMMGAPRPPSIVWALFLFLSCHVGLRAAARRYR